LGDLGRHRDAQEDFRVAAALAPESHEALRGLARADIGLGRPRRGLARLQPLLEREPEPATLVVAGSAHRAIGRPDRAEALARAALAADPEAEAPARMLEDLMLQRAPLGGLELSHVWRSDGLRISTLRSRTALAFESGLAEVAPTFRVRRFRGAGLPPVDLASLGLLVRRRFSDDLEAQSTVFLNIEDEPEGRDHSLTHETSLTVLPRDGWRFGLRWNRRYADDNSLTVLQDLFADEIGAFVEFELDRDTRLGARMLASRITDGNRRLWGQIEGARRVLRSEHQVWLGARATGFAYQRTGEEEYWSPETYRSIEATLQAFGPIAEGWGYDLTGSAGYARSQPGRGGFTTGLRGQVSRQFSTRGRISIFAAHSASLAVTEEAGGFFGGLGVTWQRTEVGAQLSIRF
jgi:tetratricopeptide (TPR) repeat protein